MIAQSIADANIYLSWVCQELCIEPDITIQEIDISPKGIVEIHYMHFADVDGNEFAQDFEKLLDESYKHAKVYVLKEEEGEWFDLHISFKIGHIKKRIYKIQSLIE